MDKRIDIEEHLMAKVNENRKEPIFIPNKFDIDRRVYSEDNPAKDIKIKRVKTEGITYNLFLEVNKLFNEYVLKLLEKPSKSMHNKILYTAELIGALIYVSNNEYIIVEERKNSIVVIGRDNRTRILIKKGLVFKMIINDVSFYFIGRNLNMNRFFKK